jgi:hypothetical protein
VTFDLQANILEPQVKYGGENASRGFPRTSREDVDERLLSITAQNNLFKQNEDGQIDYLGVVELGTDSFWISTGLPTILLVLTW